MKTRKTKKIMALLLTFLLMVASVPLLAFGEIALDSSNVATAKSGFKLKMATTSLGGETVKAYKIIKATYNNNTVSYGWTDSVVSFFENNVGDTYAEIAGNVYKFLGNDYTSTNREEFLGDYKSYVYETSNNVEPDQAVVRTSETSDMRDEYAEFTGLDQGMYAVYVDNANAIYSPVLASVQAEATSDGNGWTLKTSDENVLEAKVTYVTSNISDTVDFGDIHYLEATKSATITYEVPLSVSTGEVVLTYQNISDKKFTKKQDISAKLYKSDGSEVAFDTALSFSGSDENGYTATIPESEINKLASKGGKIVVTSKELISDEMLTGIDESTELGLQNYQLTVKTAKGQDVLETKGLVAGKVSGLKINCNDGENNPIVGAKFELYGEDGTQQYTGLLGMDGSNQFSTDANGVVRIVGLAAGNYKIKQVSIPSGYSTDDGVLAGNGFKEISFTAGSEDNTNGFWETEFVNRKMPTLPGTGGMGTTIFTITGIALMVAAGVLFVVSKKREPDVK